jgi:disulfide bond formation protein DsbB
VTQNEKLAQLLAIGVPAVLLGGAYISQYGFGLFPCELCWWQRYPHFAALGFGILSTFAPPKTWWIALAALAIMISGLIGAFHAGVEYGWWQGFTSCTSNIAESGDPMEAIFAAPLIRCDVAQWTLFGISLAGFNALISVVSSLAIFRLLGLDRRE